jgi:hypothetical protein
VNSAPCCDVHNVGILFIIIDAFPNELLWRVWLEQGGLHDTPSDNKQTDANAVGAERTDTDSDITAALPGVRCWFHAKYPERVTSPWVRERLVTSFQYKPEWGSLELTKVMVHLLHEVGCADP